MLVIGGDQSVARLFTEIFSRRDWDVDAPRDWQSASAFLVGTRRYDIILVSYRFPSQLA